ncbi:MAG: radical SAM protein [Planctomycetes bacterium B3_Pla]|nr:MAG: radical SAM protein [Planctomycetes bacterium B3_Pla]
MKLKIVYPSWPKLERQTEFHLPPHGPVVFAATVPEDVDIIFEDDNVEQINFDEHVDLAAISTMLTCQLPRAFEIAAEFRARNVPVIFGGISTILHSEEVALHADSVFLGETEGSFSKVLEDFENGRLQPIYDYMNDQPDIGLIGPARRDILKRELYNYRGVQMLDLVHASRGCKFDCFPCCSGFLGGRKFRPRPVDKVIAEMEQIPNNRLFIVDNSLAQDRDWLIELFTAMKPLKKKWVSHPILYDEEVLKLASEAGCWYVYQAIFDTSDMIRDRIKMLKDFEIGIEGTIILGLDDQDVDYIKRLVDFLCENEVDIAEFTILTPFPHSPIRQQMEKDGRILHNNWIEYSADKVVFQPLKMTPDELQDVYYYAWDTFYADSGYELRMGQLFQKLVMREIADNTYKRYDTRKPRRSISAKK